MTTRHDPDHSIAAWLQGEAPSDTPARLLTATRSRIASTTQRRAPWPRGAAGRATDRVGIAVAMAAAITVAVAGLSVLPRLVGDPGTAGESPRGTSTAESSPTEPSATTTPEDTEPAVLSLDLVWTEVDIEAGLGQVAWLDDRFVVVDSSRAVWTSTDGSNWEVLEPGDPDPGYADLLKRRASLVTWEDQFVGWSNPQDVGDVAGAPPITARDVLRIVRPPAQPIVTTPFDGRIQSLGVGPAGIVAETHFWPDERTRVDTAWFSPDGIEWTAIQDGLREFVGVSDGFIARDGIDEDLCTLPDGCGFMWHSADGLAWRNLGHPDAEPESLSPRVVPFMGGALVTDEVGRFDFWTSQGHSALPMAADFPAAGAEPDGLLATGPLGLVMIRRDSREVFFTRDGVDWKLQPIPAAMVTESDKGPTIAVGERSVLYLTWSGHFGAGEAWVPSLWVGAVVP